MQSFTPPAPRVSQTQTTLQRISKAGLLVLLMLFSCGLYAQTYPTFAAGGQLSNTIAEGYAPSLAVFSNLLFMAYADVNTGNLDIAYSNDNGATFTSPTNTGISIGSTSSPSMTVWNNKLYVAYTNHSTGQVYITYSSNGSNWSSPQPVTFLNGSFTVSTTSTVGTLRRAPAIYGIGSYLYLSFVTNVSGTNSAIIGYTENGVNFGTMLSLSSFVPVSDPTMTDYNGELAIVFGAGSHNVPIVSLARTADSQYGFAILSSTNSKAVELANDAGAVEFNGALYIFGQSYFTSDDNLWATATYNGINFETEHKYGQVVSGGPGVAVINGTLVEVARSKYNNNMWSYRATY